MTTGMTLKQMAKHRYLEGIQKYKNACKNNNSYGIIMASLQIMATKGDVPRKYWGLSSYKNLMKDIA